MGRLARWLLTPPQDFEEYLRFIARTAIVGLVYSALMALVLKLSGVQLGQIFDALYVNLKLAPIVISSGDIFLNAAIEEVLFRYFPFVFGVTCLLPLSKNADQFVRGLLMIAIVSSIIFGYAHGAWYNILLQGMVGLAFCAAFLKCGGISRKFFTGLLCSSCAHALFNISIYIMVNIRQQV